VLNHDDAHAYGVDWAWQARRAGSRVVYDSSALVWHHFAPRAKELDRTDSVARRFGKTRNSLYIGLKYLPWPQKIALVTWSVVVGDRCGLGLITYIIERARRQAVMGHLHAATRAKMAALALWWRTPEANDLTIAAAANVETGGE
jgi:GT2 family glycosyltransferase